LKYLTVLTRSSGYEKTLAKANNRRKLARTRSGVFVCDDQGPRMHLEHAESCEVVDAFFDGYETIRHQHMRLEDVQKDGIPLLNAKLFLCPVTTTTTSRASMTVPTPTVKAI